MVISDFHAILIAVSLAILQGLWIFQDARKRGLKYWYWGLLGLLSVPSVLIIYLLVTRINKSTCPNCQKQVNRDYLVCPYCREELVREE